MVKVGNKIEIIFVDDEPQFSGREGVVQHIDVIGQIHGSRLNAHLFLEKTNLK